MAQIEWFMPGERMWQTRKIVVVSEDEEEAVTENKKVEQVDS